MKKIDFQNVKNVIPLITLIAVCGAFIAWQVSYSKELSKKEQEYQKFLEEETARINAEKYAEERAALKTYLMGGFEPKDRTDFALIPAILKTNASTMYLRTEALNAFIAMAAAAEKDGAILRIASATRNFNYQKLIWNNKWKGVTLVEGKSLPTAIPDSLERFKKILEYSAVPGTSRHHWGTEIDINDANPGYFQKPAGIKVYDWLAKNASKYGFCQVYNAKNELRPTGFEEEKWHWSYLPLAKDFTKEYAILVKEEDIKGFLGDENVAEQDLINEYVLGINPECI